MLNSYLLSYPDEFRALADFTYALRWLTGTVPTCHCSWGELVGCFHGNMTDPYGRVISRRR